MVDPWVLTNDLIGGVGSLVLTPVLWIALFLWAWTRPAAAQASGFGRMTFWLLLPGAFLGSLADAPFLPWAGNVLAINVGGALIPIALSIVLLHRTLSVPSWSLTARVLLLVAVEAAAQFAIVVLTTNPWTPILVLAAAGAVVAIAGFVLPTWAPHPTAMRALTFVGLVSVAIPITFFTSVSVPGQGIESAFPYYLIAPWLVGLLAAWLAVMWWDASPISGLGIGYGTATFGTLIGADVLREPPLYTGGGGALLAIGGAGVEDLVYFSGLLALGAGLLLIAVRYRGAIPAPAPSSPASPEELLRQSTVRLAAGDTAGATHDAVSASREAANRVRSVFQLPAPADAAATWDGLPVAPYVVNDYRNLVASESTAAASPREAYRSVAMSTQLVRLGRDLTRLRFAAPGPRGWAAAIDCLVVTLPAVALWVYLAWTLPGSVEAVLLGLPFNLAVFAYVGYAVLYYVASDALFGTTLGKHWLHLRVTDRQLARPTWLQALLRESPKAIAIYLIGEFGAPAILWGARSSSSPLSDLVVLAVSGAVLLGIVIVGLAAIVAIGAAEVSRDSERQRLGDRWASTWVVDRRQVTPAWGALHPAPASPPAPVPPG